MFNVVQPVVQSQVNFGGGNQQNLSLTNNVSLSTNDGFTGLGGSNAFASAFSGPGFSLANALASGGFGTAIASSIASGGLSSAFASAFAGSGFGSSFASAIAGAGGTTALSVANTTPVALQPFAVPYPVPVGGGATAVAQAQSGSSSSLFMLIVLLALLGKRNRQPEPPVFYEPPPPPPAPPAPPAVSVAVATGGGLQQRITEIRKKGSPLVLDLNGDGIRTSPVLRNFDIFGNGRPATINDVSQGDGLLVFDADQDGVAGENGTELLGDNTDLNGDGVKEGYRDGFEALRSMADAARAQGLISNDDYLDATELALLERAYGLRIKTGGLDSEALSLLAAGVTGINLANGEKTRTANFDGFGNDLLSQGGATFTRSNGTTGSYADVFFAPVGGAKTV